MMQREHDCVGCGYPLRGLGVRGRCPECGGRFDLMRLPRKGEQPLSARELASKLMPTARTLAIILLLLGAAATLAGLGWAAFERFRNLPAFRW